MRADLLEVKDRMEERWLELQFKIRGTAVELWEKTWTKNSRPLNQNSLEYIFNECNLSVLKKNHKIVYIILIKLKESDCICLFFLFKPICVYFF